MRLAAGFAPKSDPDRYLAPIADLLPQIGLDDCVEGGNRVWATRRHRPFPARLIFLGGLAAEGETMIDRVYHIDRGYERIVKKLSSIGGDIKRIKEDISLGEDVKNLKDPHQERSQAEIGARG